MLVAYYFNNPISATTISVFNDWLRFRFNDPRYTSTVNGWYTNLPPYSSRNELGTLLSERLTLKYAVLTGSSDLFGPVYELSQGHPPIMAVMISGGRLVATGGVAHWVLLVGWEAATRTVIVNDPGTRNGNGIRYPAADFDKSWKTQDRVYVRVTR
jgi:hypothetical protein